MRVNLPYSRNRRYLTGIDWTLAALDTLSRRTTGGGNTFQIVLELKGPLDPDRFRSLLQLYIAQFPVLAGRPSRDWTLAPYWKMPRRAQVPSVPVEFVQVGSGGDVFAMLEQSANRPLQDRRTHLAIRVFPVDANHHFVAAQFDHRLFDAAGAEAFLGLFQSWMMGEACESRLAKISLKEPAHLCDWLKKFEAGKQLVRALRQYAGSPLMVLPRPTPLRGRKTKFMFMEFSGEESRAIVERANQQAGFLMFMPYTLAGALQALAPAFARHGAAGQVFLVSVSVDLRSPETLDANLFFNHISFLFFQVPVSLMQDRTQLLDSLRRQMYEQVKSGFPKALHESSMLMRILPLKLLSRLMVKPLGGEFASMGFTCVGKSGYPFDRFMEAQLVNLIHMPLVPVPPGLGFFISQVGSKFNAVLSYVDGMLTEDDVRLIQEDVRRLL